MARRALASDAAAVDEIGGYVLESKLGEGGMGAVYRARHPRFPGRAFALKVMSTRDDAESLARFEREMKALAIATQHQNVVRIFGGAVDGERPFFVMELVDGVPLSRTVREKPLEPDRAARIVHAIADAVAHVHEHGVIHRDLKPANVLLEAGDRPRVCDFGLASVAGAERLTKTGAFLGTPGYSAPEQLDGRAHQADARADVYALGGILHFLLAGKAPFEAASEPMLITKVLLQPPKPPSWTNPSVPQALDAVCLKALEKEPERRYATAAELRDELGRFLAGEPVLARVPGRVERFVRALRRRRREARIVAAGLAALAVVGALVGKHIVDRDKQRLADQAIRDEALHLTSSAAIEQKLAVMKTEDLKQPVLEHLARRKRVEAKAAELGAPAAAALDDVAGHLLEDAAEAIETPAASALPLADGLLERRVVLLRSATLHARLAPIPAALLKAASAVAAARSDPREAAALGALVALAEKGAPWRPLGAGRLAGAPLEAVRKALEAASKGNDALAARTAGLLVDLELCAGNAAGAKAALGAHAALAAEDRASFERILATPATGPGMRELARGPCTARRAAELARFFALGGAPGAIDHPEAADETVSLEEIARLDHPAPRGEHESPAASAYADKAGELLEPIHDLHKDHEFRSVTESEIDERWVPVAGKFEACVKAALAEDPRSGAALFHAGNPLRRTVSTAIFRVLATADRPQEVFELAECFCEEDRKVLAMGWSAEPYDLAVWTFREDAPWKDFDERLAASVASDALAGALAAEDRARGLEACKALFRLDVLVQSEPGGSRVLDDGVRAELALEAVRGVERLRRLGSTAAIPYGARALRFALPGALGRRLAELELRRALAWGRDALPKENTLHDGAFYLVLVAADFAAEDQATVKLALELYDLIKKLIVPFVAREQAKPPEDRAKQIHELNFLTIRSISKKLREALVNDPTHAAFEQDFSTR